MHRAVNSCLRPLCAVDGMMVTTTEGIGSVREGLDPVQHCIAANNGTQCGFCTPGFVMNAHAFLQQNPAPTAAGDRGHLRRQPLPLHGLSPDPARRADAGPRLRCRRGPDAAMPDRTRRSRSSAGSELARIDLDVLPPPGRRRGRFISRGSGREWYRPGHARRRSTDSRSGSSVRPAGSRSSSSSATPPSGVYQRGEAALPHRHLRHRRTGADRRRRSGNPRRRRRPDPAADRFRDRGDRPAARRSRRRGCRP